MIALAGLILGLIAIGVRYDTHYQKEIREHRKEYLDDQFGKSCRSYGYFLPFAL